MSPKRVIIESPLAGDFIRNRRYSLWCLYHSLQLGEAPFASRLLYTQSLDDTKPGEREMGIVAGLAWGEVAELRALYTDLGTSPGMMRGLQAAEAAGQEFVTRILPEEMFEAFKRGEYPKATEGFREGSCR